MVAEVLVARFLPAGTPSRKGFGWQEEDKAYL
jgi:hypothetical protein